MLHSKLYVGFGERMGEYVRLISTLPIDDDLERELANKLVPPDAAERAAATRLIEAVREWDFADEGYVIATANGSGLHADVIAEAMRRHRRARDGLRAALDAYDAATGAMRTGGKGESHGDQTS